MRKLLPIVLAITTGCAALPVEDRERVYPVSELSVDNVTSKTYFGSEQEAFERMMDAAIDSHFEDAWLSYEQDGIVYFVDVGKDARNSCMTVYDDSGVRGLQSGCKTVEPDREKIWKVLLNLHSGTQVRFYHIHPFSDEIARVHKSVGGQYMDLSDIAEYLAFPSGADFINDLQIKAVARSMAPQVEFLPERVFGVSGYSEFSTSEEALGEQPLDINDENGMRDLGWKIQINSIVPYSKVPYNPSPNRMEECRKVFNESGLKTTYKKLREVPENLKVKDSE